MKCISRALLLFSLSLCLGPEAADPPLIVAQSLPGRLPGTLPGQQPPAAPKPAPAPSSAPGPDIPAACCEITAIDKAKSVVSARERASGRIVEFKVGNSALLKKLDVGQAVHANFNTKQVSVDGKTMCCTITSVAAPPTVASKTPAQSASPAQKAPQPPQAQPPPKTAAADPAKTLGAPQALPGQRLPGQPPAGAPAPAKPTTAQAPLPSRAPPAEPAGQGMSSTASGATSGSTKTKTTTGGGLGSIKTDTSNVKASEGDTATAIRGKPAHTQDTKATSQAAKAEEPADDDAQDDPEPVERPKTRAVAGLGLPTMRAGAKGTKLTEYADAQKMLDEIAKGIAAKEIDVALVGGEKYKINKCLGVKASAGTFKLKFASPNARIEGSGARLTFRINSVSINALKIRMKPNAGNPLKLCHWSKKHTVGGAATNITYELRFDPVLDLEQCKLGSLGIVKHRLDIGGLNLKPLQNDLDRAAKNMIEDAYNNAANLNMSDRIIASANAFLGVQCKR